jgi:hypothetical protein
MGMHCKTPGTASQQIGFPLLSFLALDPVTSDLISPLIPV